MDEENMTRQQRNPAAEGASNAAKNVARDAVKKAAKDGAKNALKSTTSNAVRAFLAPLMPWIVGIVVILVLVVGIIMFFVSGMGLIYAALDAMADQVKEFVAEAWYGSKNVVQPYEIIQVADKIETMGYDLYGEGFVTDPVPEDEKIGEGVDEYREEIGQPIVAENVYLDPSGIQRDNYGITNMDSDIIRRYLISDNYMYTLYNEDKAFEGWSHILSGHVSSNSHDGFILPRSGLIKLIEEQDGKFGTYGGYHGTFSVSKLLKKIVNLTIGGHVSCSINLENKTLDITSSTGILFWKKSNVLSYNLDGWTGRYGMPLEFLLSLHLASEQPDLVLDFLNNFDTNVNIGLHPSKAAFVPGIEISGQIITLQDLIAVGEDDFIKTFYPSYWEQLQEEAAAQAAEEAAQNPDDTSTTTDTAAQAEEEYRNKVSEAISGKTSSDSGADGKALYEVDAGSQGENGATKMMISEDGDIYRLEENEDGTKSYVNTGVKYRIVEEGQREYDITEEDSEHLTYSEVYTALFLAAGGEFNSMETLGTDVFNTYLPYIRNVSNHWFRDAYFVLGTDSQFIDENGSHTIRIIENDKDFEYTVGERWTLYETDENGNYTLYLVNDDGSIGDRYNGTQEQALKENIRVTRKAITKLVDEKAAEDDEFKAGISGGMWTAYDINPSGVTIDWTQWDEDARAFPKGVSDLIKEKLKYQITVTNQIIQKRDGERAATNATVKKMLTRYSYYTYDGSKERADAIAEDRKANNDYKHEDEYGHILDGTASDPRNQNLVGKFAINADSLSAFKILENMNTLDADQIYRDFKELIVELNYFDKEELAGLTEVDVFQWPLPDTGTIGWPVREFSKNTNEFGTLIHSKVDLKNLYDIYAKTAKSEEQGGGPSDPDEENDEGNDNEEEITAVVNDVSSMGQMFRNQKESLYAVQGKTSHKMEGSGSGFGQSTFFDTAQACWDFIVQHGGSISYGALGACPFATPGGNHKSSIDCSGFVTWVLYEWGTGEIKSYFANQRATPTLMKDNYQDLFGWTQIELGADQDAKPLLQPGDILVRDNGEGGAYGHTAIVKEVNGDVVGWDCGSASNWQTDCTETTIGSGFVSGDGRKGKIIRIEEIQKPAEKYKGYEGNTDVVSPVTGEIIEAGKQVIKNIETNEEEEVGYIKLKVMTTEDFQALDPPTDFNIEDISDLDDEKKNYAGFRYFYEDYQYSGVLGMYIMLRGFDVRIVDENLNLTSDSTIREDGQVRNKYHKHDYNDVIGEKTRKILQNKEKLRDYALSTITFTVNGEEKLYVKEGTVLGKTYTDGDLEEFSDVSEIDKDEAVVRPCVAAGETAEYPEMMFSNGKKPNWEEFEDDEKPTGNYIQVILRTAEDGQINPEPNDENPSNTMQKDNIIEDVEDYFELDDPDLYGDQPYKAQPGDLELLASLIHHENCVGAKSYLGIEDGERASKATGYVCVNRALVNFGNHGTTIRQQIEAPGQYASKDAVINEGDYCDGCLEMAEWCLTYDCNSISNPSTNEEMTRNTVFQAGFCQCSGGKYNCWWVCDNAKDGATLTEYPSNPWDTFYCKSPQYEDCP